MEKKFRFVFPHRIRVLNSGFRKNIGVYFTFFSIKINKITDLKLFHRHLAFNDIQIIDNSDDFDNLVKEINAYGQDGLVNKIFTNHQNQSCFDKSGYRPLGILSTVFYLTKF
jgi:hypothetical protein